MYSVWELLKREVSLVTPPKSLSLRVAKRRKTILDTKLHVHKISFLHCPRCNGIDRPVALKALK